jgi:membrane protein CcdC involved in cytochrome C biogenesis
MVMTVVVVVLVIGLVVKRFLGEPLNLRDLAVPPVVLTGIGVYHLVDDVHLSGGEIVWVVVASIVGLVFGAVRGLTPKLFVKDGHLWQRYTVWTVVVWVVSAAANFGIGYLAGLSAEVRPMTLSIGVSLLGEAVSLGIRGFAAQVPFAPERR